MSVVSPRKVMWFRSEHFPNDSWNSFRPDLGRGFAAMPSFLVLTISRLNFETSAGGAEPGSPVRYLTIGPFAADYDRPARKRTSRDGRRRRPTTGYERSLRFR